MQHPPDMGNCTGARVFISRNPENAQDFIAPLQAKGATVFAASLIETTPRSFIPPPPEAYDWILITSQKAAETALPMLPVDKPVATVGPATSQTVKALGFAASLQPETHHANELAKAFLETFAGHPLRILWPCGSLANPKLEKELEAGGMQVIPLVVYDTRSVTMLPRDIENALKDGMDLLAFTSPSSVQSFQEHRYPTKGSMIVSIGPSTTAAVQQAFTLRPHEARLHTLSGLAKTALTVLSPGA